jgi:hypothetical protein
MCWTAKTKTDNQLIQTMKNTQKALSQNKIAQLNQTVVQHQAKVIHMMMTVQIEEQVLVK